MFNDAINSLFFFEGGYSLAQNDAGGETFKGISRNYHPEWPGWHLVDKLKGDKHALETDPALDAAARDFYRATFWDKYQLGAITDIHVSGKILDLLVNCGPDGGATVVQKALNNLGIHSDVDGKFGLLTLAQCNQAEPIELLAEIRAEAALHYALIVLKSPTQLEFLRGWLRRAVRP